MSCSPNKAISLLLAAAALAALAAGCIADTPADSDMPWATSQSWEGLTPLPGASFHQYD